MKCLDIECMCLHELNYINTTTNTTNTITTTTTTIIRALPWRNWYRG